ncbi:hypothetical protein Tco_1306804, partial [Tanacetum coccineum]
SVSHIVDLDLSKLSIVLQRLVRSYTKDLYLSPQHTPVSAPSTSPPPITETTATAEEPAPMPHESLL